VAIEESRRVSARSQWLEIYKQTNSVSKAARKCGVPRSTIYRWIARFETEGEAGLQGRSRRPKRLTKLKVTTEIADQILKIRAEKKWGPQRIQTYFHRTAGPPLSVPTIWRVLKQNNVKQIKKYRRPKDYHRYSRSVPGDRVQIDVTKIRAGQFQYTALSTIARA